MRLRALSLTNVRRFGGRTATLSGFGDGVSVVAEANEFGKSTFFDALHALVFEKHGATGKTVRSLQPYAGGAVRVAADIETAGGLFRVEKRWLSGKGASVLTLSGDRVIARDDEAEAWIAQAIGAGREGPAGLLWVRQGAAGFDTQAGSAAAKAERDRLVETRRDLLSSVAGEIDTLTGGRRMDRVLARCKEDLARITTPTGRPTGAWSEAIGAVQAIETAHAEQVAACARLSEALDARRIAQERLARLAAPEARTARQRARDQAAAALAQAEAHGAELARAAQALALARLDRKAADEALSAHDAAVTAASQADAALERAAQALAEARQAGTDSSARRDAARRALETARERRSLLARQAEAARTYHDARQAAARSDELAARASLAEAQNDALAQARLRRDALSATPERLAAAEEADRALARLQAAAEGRAPVLRMHYDGAARVCLNGQAVPPDTPLSLPPRSTLDLPGLGRMEIRSLGSEGDGADAALAGTRAALTAALAACGAKTLDEARSAAAARRDAQDAKRNAEGALAVLAPEGIDALRQTAAQARATAAVAADLARATGEAAQATGSQGGPAGLTAEQAEADEREAQDRFLDREREALAAAEATRAADERWREAVRLRDAAIMRAGPETDRAGQRALLCRRAEEAGAALALAEQHHDALSRAAPDIDSARAEATRATSAAKQADDTETALRLELAALGERIALEADRSPEEARDALAGQLETARAQATRLADEAAALTRLRDVLDSARRAARDAYFEPVRAEMDPLLRLLHAEAALSFDPETLLPDSISRGGVTETLEMLSGGTREQIAILARLAFARLFARQGRPIPVILDDALVHSDDTRILRMFTALHRAASDLQIVVFTCRQMAFADLGGTRPVFSLTVA